MKEMCDKMKIKFSKTLAIACILCMTFATLTAFADVTVKTTTTYDFEAAADANMTVTTTVAGLSDNGEITYYVSKVEEGAEKIVYIDQATASGNTATFEFVAATNDVITATAKHGSDKSYVFPVFNFNAGNNYLTQGSPTVTKVVDNWAKLDSSYGDNAYVFQGTITGTGAEYGLMLNGEFFRAKGCDEAGNFAIVIQGIDAATAAKAEPYPVPAVEQ